MGLDVHVMPLWKFWAGEYTTDRERQFPNMRRIGGQKKRMSRESAQEQDAWLQGLYGQALNQTNLWDSQFAETFSFRFNVSHLHVLRAYAAYLDYPPTTGWLWKKKVEFDPGGDASAYPPLGEILLGKTTSFAHLIKHEDHSGWYLPAKFQRIFPAEEGCPSAGSSFQLKRELTKIADSLDHPGNWNALGSSDSDAEPTTREVLIYSTSLLLECAKLSLQHHLPIIFDG